MTEPDQGVDRQRMWVLYLAVSLSFFLFCLVVGYLFVIRLAPLLPKSRDSLPAWIMAAAGIPPLVLGLMWTRSKVPIRPREMDVEAYWRTTEAGRWAFLTWVLWEGGGMMGAVGALLFGSVGAAALATMALSLLVLHVPSFFETREY